MHHLSWVEASVVGLLQGVSELFPVSSLGHSVLIPALVGGSWARDLNVHDPESPYLAFIVGLHVATAIALVIFFRRDWLRIIGGFVTSVRDREVVTSEQRLAWLLILATIPVGVSGLLLEHTLRTVLARPVVTSLFLALNGLILLGAEQLVRRPAGGPVGPHGAAVPAAPDGPGGWHATDRADAAIGRGPSAAPAASPASGELVAGWAADQRLARLPVGRAVLIGAAQIAALAPGISRSGVTMSAGLLRGLDHEDAARFSFLLATPVILAAGLLKIPDLMGPLGNGIRGPVLLGSLLSGLGAYVSVRYLVRWFENRSLRPFGVYCLVAGLGCLLWFGVR